VRRRARSARPLQIASLRQIRRPAKQGREPVRRDQPLRHRERNTPGSNGLGLINQGYVERRPSTSSRSSSPDPDAASLTRSIPKAIQTSDKMLQKLEMKRLLFHAQLTRSSRRWLTRRSCHYDHAVRPLVHQRDGESSSLWLRRRVANGTSYKRYNYQPALRGRRARRVGDPRTINIVEKHPADKKSQHHHQPLGETTFGADRMGMKGKTFQGAIRGATTDMKFSGDGQTTRKNVSRHTQYCDRHRGLSQRQYAGQRRKSRSASNSASESPPSPAL